MESTIYDDMQQKTVMLGGQSGLRDRDHRTNLTDALDYLNSEQKNLSVAIGELQSKLLPILRDMMDEESGNDAEPQPDDISDAHRNVLGMVEYIRHLRFIIQQTIMRVDL